MFSRRTDSYNMIDQILIECITEKNALKYFFVVYVHGIWYFLGNIEDDNCYHNYQTKEHKTKYILEL